MRLQSALGTVVVAMALAAPLADARAGTTLHSVRGKVAAADAAEGGASGTFRLTDVASEGTTFQRFSILVRGLDAGGAESPAFEVVLDDGTQTASLGTLHLFGADTRGWLRFDTRRDALPEGVTSLRAFSGGTVRVTLGGHDVATGSIPSFVEPEGPDQGGAAPPQALALGFGSTILGDPSGGAPAAKVTAYAVNSFLGLSQGIAVSAVGLDADATYTVVLTGETTDTLGAFETRSFWGHTFGGMLVSTRRGDAIPGGSVGQLAGRGIEIRDAAGLAVLTGTFPALD